MIDLSLETLDLAAGGDTCARMVNGVCQPVVGAHCSNSAKQCCVGIQQCGCIDITQTCN